MLNTSITKLIVSKKPGKFQHDFKEDLSASCNLSRVDYKPAAIYTWPEI